MFSFEYSISNRVPASSMDMKMYYCGTQDCEGNKAWGPALLDHYKIFYIYKGSGLFRMDNRDYDIKEGQCVLIPPNVITYYKSNEKDKWLYDFVAFNGVNAKGYLMRAGFLDSNFIIECNGGEIIRNDFNQMLEDSKNKISGDMKILGSLYNFLGSIIEYSCQEESEGENKVSNSYIKKAIDFIEVNHCRDVKIAEIATYLGINRKYFSKLFKDAVGIPPQNYLINLRLNKSCELMKNKILSIGEIARSVGYEDQLLFSRVFKKFKGISPNNYRKDIV